VELVQFLIQKGRKEHAGGQRPGDPAQRLDSCGSPWSGCCPCPRPSAPEGLSEPSAHCKEREAEDVGQHKRDCGVKQQYYGQHGQKVYQDPGTTESVLTANQRPSEPLAASETNPMMPLIVLL
jgi:hypothetical protein